MTREQRTAGAARTPFFIVGSGRSGTTLLRSLLSAHTEITVTPETHYMKRAFRDGAETRDAPADFEVFWRELLAWSRFRELEVDAEAVRRIVERDGERTFRDVFAAILTAYGDRHGKPRVGEKTPGHYRFLDKILAWFPQAQVVVLRRDPRDVVASQLNAPWITEQLAPQRATAPLARRLRLYHVAERALLWRQAHGEYLADADRNPRMHVVCYERLVSEPEQELMRICDFLGHAFEPEMLRPRVPAKGEAAPGSRWAEWEKSHHASAGSAISASSVGRWRKALAPHEAALIESICAHAMERHGYRCEMPRSARRLIGHALLQAGMIEDRLRGTPQVYRMGQKPRRVAVGRAG